MVDRVCGCFVVAIHFATIAANSSVVVPACAAIPSSSIEERRPILESDVLHGRRPDGRDIDWLLHVNPALPAKALLVVHNPLTEPVQRTLALELRRAGLGATVTARACAPGAAGQASEPPSEVPVDGRGFAWFTVALPEHGFAAFEFR